MLHFGHNQNTLQKCIIKDSACALFGPPYSGFTPLHVNTTNPPIWDFHSISIQSSINYVAINMLWYHLQIV
jgi:hypothetical protein